MFPIYPKGFGHDPQLAAVSPAPHPDQVQAGGSHYKEMTVQPWHVMQSVLTPAEFRGFLKGNIIKYAMRAGRKGAVEDDVAKLQHYREKLASIENFGTF